MATCRDAFSHEYRLPESPAGVKGHERVGYEAGHLGVDNCLPINSRERRASNEVNIGERLWYSGAVNDRIFS